MGNYQTRVNQELLLDFFLTFSRFEYALKVSGFFKMPDQSRYDPRCPPSAEPDWDSFAVSLRGFFLEDRTERLRQACEYLLESPPDRQVIIRDGCGWATAWETPIRPRHETDIEFILRMARRVRNNLFHGGKHNIELHEETERTEHLLRCSLTILKQCLDLSPSVKDFFDQAII